jgi:hypothetical protein
MFYDEIENDKYLYHFTTHTTALEHIFPNQTIRFSPFSKTNDPRESKDWNFTFHSKTEPSDYRELISLQNEFNKTLKAHTKILCFARDVPLKDEWINWLHPGRGFSRPRMWAQYAGNHQGVCLVFDKQKLNRVIHENLKQKDHIYNGAVDYNISNYHAFSLNLDEIKSKGFEEYIKNHLATNHKHLFLEKNNDWKDEAEYRWILFNKENTDYEYVKYKDALVAIILGIDFPPVYEIIIQSYCEKFNIHATRVYWENGGARIIPIYNPESKESGINKLF